MSVVKRGLIISRGLRCHACSGGVLLGFRWAVNLLICLLQPVRGETPNTVLLQPRKFHVHKTHGTNSDSSYYTIQNPLKSRILESHVSTLQ